MGQCYSEQKIEPTQTPVIFMEKCICNITIKLSQGNIIDENVDAVVAIADPQFNVKSRTSKQIIQQGGHQMMEELLTYYRKRKQIDFGEIIYAHAEELDYDFVLFALLPGQYEIDADVVWRQKMKQMHSFLEESIDTSLQYEEFGDQKQYIQLAIKNSLMICSELGLNSIGFPVISAESEINSKCYTALVMLLAIKQFLEEKNQLLKNLEYITITIADKAYIKPFKHVLSRLTDGQQIIDYYETPQLGAQEDNIFDSVENEFKNDIIQFGLKHKNRREPSSKNDSI